MRGRLSFLFVLVVGAGCKETSSTTSDGGPQAKGPDYAANFVGDWFGVAHAVFTDASSRILSSTTYDAEQSIIATGKNALRLPVFCSSTDPGPAATVVSAAEFSVAPYDCRSTSNGCTQRTWLDGGSGTLDGGTLTLSMAGRVQLLPAQGCVEQSADFTLSFVATHQDPRLVQLDPPDNVAVELTDTFCEFALRWTPPDAGYVQWFASRPDVDPGGGWMLLYVNQTDDRSGTTYLPANELETIHFLAVTTNGYAMSGPSPELEINTTYAPPYGLNLYVFRDQSQAVLEWNGDHPQALGLQLERAETQAGVDGPFETLVTVLNPATQYVDTPPREATALAYRGRWVKPTVEGRPFRAPSMMLTPYDAPAGLQLLPRDDGSVDLQWVNVSSKATMVIVSRSDEVYDNPPFTELARLASTATSYNDRPPYAGGYTYAVQAAGSFPTSSLISARVVAVSPGLSMDQQLVELPYGQDPRRDSDGHWYFIAGPPGSTVQRSGDPGWQPHPVPSGLPANSLLLDSKDQPHIAYLSQIDPSTFAVLHEWFDGAWHSDELTRVPGGVMSWSLDPSDHALVAVATAGALKVVRWSSSGYVPEDASTSGTAWPVADLRVAAGPSGQIQVAVSTTNHTVLRFERTTSWSSETVPQSFARPRIVGLFPAAGGVDILGWDDDTFMRFVLHRDTGTWSAPQLLGILGLQIGLPPLFGAARQDGTRPTALLYDDDGFDTLRYGADGWSPHSLGSGNPIVQVGYARNGKTYALVFAGPGATGMNRYIEFVER